MKCEICGKEIGETFLGKIKGSIFRTVENKREKIHYICSECQNKNKGKTKEQIIKGD